VCLLPSPTFYTFFGPSATQNSESLRRRRDEVLRLISSPDDIGTACSGRYEEHRYKKCCFLSTVNGDWQVNSI